MNKVTVYNFQVLDRQAGQLIPDARMAIAATIRGLKAEADLTSALEVDKSKVDDAGFYVESPPLGDEASMPKPGASMPKPQL